MSFKHPNQHNAQTVIEPFPLTPQEIRAEVARERREVKKERQLDRKVKRQNKRSQCF